MKFLTLSLVVLSKVSSLVSGQNSEGWKSLSTKDSFADNSISADFDGVLMSSPRTYINNSITSISTYSLPKISTTHHARKLHNKLRRHRRISTQAPKVRSHRKFKPNETAIINKLSPTLAVSSIKEISNNATSNEEYKSTYNFIKLKTRPSFIDDDENVPATTKVINPLVVFSENRTTGNEFLTKMQSKDSSKRKKKKRKNKTSANESVTKEVASNDTDSKFNYGNALSVVQTSTSSSIGEPRTMSLLLMNAFTIPAILLELITIAAFIFVSPVLGFGVILMAILGALIGGLGFLFFI